MKIWIFLFLQNLLTATPPKLHKLLWILNKIKWNLNRYQFTTLLRNYFPPLFTPSLIEYLKKYRYLNKKSMGKKEKMPSINNRNDSLTYCTLQLNSMQTIFSTMINDYLLFFPFLYKRHTFNINWFACWTPDKRDCFWMAFHEWVSSTNFKQQVFLQFN